MEFGILLRFVELMNLKLILNSCFSIQGREPYLYDFIKINFYIGLYSKIYWPISFQLGLMIEITKLYSLNDLNLHSRLQLF